MSLMHTVKQFLEASFGLHIYRTGTPLGLDLKNDLRRLVPQFEPRIILDVGANVGQTSLYFNSLWPDADIYAFEPVSATYEKLTRAVASHAPKIKCVKLALSDEAGQADIYISTDSVQSSFDPTRIWPSALSGEKESVSKSTVTRWCDAMELDTIDLMKVDAEGHDLRVLMGATHLFEQGRIGAVVVEIHLGHGVEPTLDAIRAWLEPYGYFPCAIYRQESYAFSKIFWGDFLFVPGRMATR